MDATSESTESTPFALRIPPEILIRIIECIPGLDFFNFRTRRKFPWTYTHVCQYWRDIITSTGSLWQPITIGPTPTSLRMSHDKALADWATEHARVSSHLERARDLPLYVKVTARWNVIRNCTSAVELLAQQHRRWNEAELDFHRDLGCFYRLCDTWSFAELRRLLLNAERSPHPDDEGEPHWKVFMQAPKLTTLELYGLKLGALHVLWSQLTHLRLYNVRADETILTEALNQARLLEELAFSAVIVVRQNDSVPTSDFATVTLPYLTKLKFITSRPLRRPEENGSRKDAGQRLLLSLLLPSLSNLSLHAPFNSLGFASKCLKTGLWPNGVTSLSVCDDTDSKSDEDSDSDNGFTEVIDLLERLSDLASLHVAFPRDRLTSPNDSATDLDRLLAHLCLSSGRETRLELCPRLETLVLEDAATSERTPELLVEFLASRVPMPHPANVDKREEGFEQVDHFPDTFPRRLREVLIGCTQAGTAPGEDELTKEYVSRIAVLTANIHFKLD